MSVDTNTQINLSSNIIVFFYTIVAFRKQGEIVFPRVKKRTFAICEIIKSGQNLCKLFNFTPFWCVTELQHKYLLTKV